MFSAVKYYIVSFLCSSESLFSIPFWWFWQSSESLHATETSKWKQTFRWTQEWNNNPEDKPFTKILYKRFDKLKIFFFETFHIPEWSRTVLIPDLQKLIYLQNFTFRIAHKSVHMLDIYHCLQHVPTPSSHPQL